MSFLEKTLSAIRFIGVGGVLNALYYGLLRNWLALRFRTTRPTGGWPTPGPLQTVHPLDSGARWSFTHTSLEITFLKPDLIRCEWAGGTPPLPCALVRNEWEPVSVRLHEVSDGWQIQSNDLSVLVRGDGSLSFYDSRGRVLREEHGPAYKSGNWIHCAKLRPEERLYGLGERAAPLNLRGGTYRMWNQDPSSTYRSGDDPLYLCIPVYMGKHDDGSYLVFYENPFDATFNLGATDTSIARVCIGGGTLREYFIAGPLAHALGRYTELTGRPPLPPRWALGYHQSRWGYRSAADVREIVEGFKEHDLPLHAIFLDLDYMDGCRVFTVDHTSFPDLAGLARELAEQGIRLVTIIDPGVKWDPDYDVFQEGLAGGHFCTLPDGKPVRAPVWPGMCAFPDFTRAATRAWWGQYYTRLLDAGVAGFWHDMNEPAVFAAWGEATLPRVTRHYMEGRHGDHSEAHNIYGLLQVQAAYESWRTQRPEYRPFIISRSGWAGLQRYAWTSTGDTVSSWESLNQTIATVLGLGLSGIPYTGPDIGGFSGKPSAELFLRWFQMATFMPLYRNHSALNTPRREPWTFGEPYFSILREFLRLRERLLPYLYTLCWDAAQTGTPLVRPLFWLDDSDVSTWDVDNAFLLGNDLLVAPVLQPGAATRDIVLPEGHWYNFWDDTTMQGPNRIKCATPLTHIPVLVRAGSLLPLADEDRLVLNIFVPPSGSGSGQLYSDAGDGYGTWRLDHFTMNHDADGIRVNW
jgi:alpha-glucosidase